jgi:Flp pilus assembly protein TadG
MWSKKLSISDRCKRAFEQFKHDAEGVTAIEFGLVALPFLMLLFGIMAVGLFFFTQFSLENAVWAASRDLRTGVYQTNASGSRYFGLTSELAKDEFKKSICDRTPSYVSANCTSDIRVLVQSYTGATSNTASTAPITKPNCLATPSTLVSNTDAKASFSTGSQSSVVLVTVCYAYRLGGLMPFLKFGSMGGGVHLIQASAAFQSEPYSGSGS